MGGGQDLPNDVGELKRMLAEALQQKRELEKQVGDGGSRPQPEQATDVTPLTEADVTLRRLVQRIAMILQAEKIV